MHMLHTQQVVPCVADLTLRGRLQQKKKINVSYDQTTLHHQVQHNVQWESIAVSQQFTKQ